MEVSRLTIYRVTASKIASIVAKAFLFTSLIIFIWMWVYAYLNDYIPDTPWGEKLGNHGSWRHHGFLRAGFNLRDVFWYIFIL